MNVITKKISIKAVILFGTEWKSMLPTPIQNKIIENFLLVMFLLKNNKIAKYKKNIFVKKLKGSAKNSRLFLSQ